jgi:DNA invertase Pin-like site-specific DNA recombinase
MPSKPRNMPLGPQRDKKPSRQPQPEPAKKAGSDTAIRGGSKPSVNVPPGKRVALYCRVSTADGRQTVANQVADLTAVADRLGWQITEVITDEASGTKDREKRPGYDRLLIAITRREIDMVAVWSVDRLARSLSELVAFLSEVQNRGIDLYLHQQAIDTTTPAGRALFQMLGVFAEFERALIVDRVRAGLQRAKSNGTRLGRPGLPEATRLRIAYELNRKTAVRAIARKFKIAPITVRRIRAELTSS